MFKFEYLDGTLLFSISARTIDGAVCFGNMKLDENVLEPCDRAKATVRAIAPSKEEAFFTLVPKTGMQAIRSSLREHNLA